MSLLFMIIGILLVSAIMQNKKINHIDSLKNNQCPPHKYEYNQQGWLVCTECKWEPGKD